MKEHPIIFTADSVRKILSGKKTQTRRIVTSVAGYREFVTSDRKIHSAQEILSAPGNEWIAEATCFPYGKPGDRLWVRETWGAVWPGLDWVPLKECKIEYRAVLPAGDTDYPGGWAAEDAHGSDEAPKWRSPFHMPRWASRITLEITAARVERLQSISDDDICWELGAPLKWDGEGPEPYRRDLRGCFEFEWNLINGKRAMWASNPWVWVIGFKRVQP